MKIKRTIPPAAAPIYLKDLWNGLTGLFSSEQSVKRLEEEIRHYFGIRHVFLVSSGKAALTLILQALKSLSRNRTEVIIPAYTCFSVPSAIVKAGLTVGLCDIDPVTLDFNYTLLESTINDTTLCVVPCHLFGIPSNADRARELCEGRGIFLVEDTAQAMGGIYKGKKLGTLGDVGFFSLGRGKNITCGSGGIIVTDSDAIALAINGYYSRLESPTTKEVLIGFLKVIAISIFVRPSLYWLPAGLPFLGLGKTLFYKDFPIKRLSGMEAGVLKDWRRRLKQSNQARKKNAAKLCERLGLRIADECALPYLRLPLIMESREVRDRIHSLSQKQRLGISPMYPTSLNEIDEIKENFNGRTFPFARQIAESLLTLPTHPFLSYKDISMLTDLLGYIPRILHMPPESCVKDAPQNEASRHH